MDNFFIQGLANFGLGVHSILNQGKKPTSGSVEEMSAAWPDWQCAINMAQNALVSVSVGGSTKGNGVFIEKDLVLIPKHLLMSEYEEAVCDQNLATLVESIEVCFSNNQCCYAPVKVQLIEEEGDTEDYCLLRLFDHSLPCFIPSHKFGSHSTQCLFAEVAPDGSLTVSIVSPCETYQDQMCSPYEHWTRPGSSGGVYLDQSGQLIGIHIGQSSGICRNETGRERSYLPIGDVVFNSQFCCTLDKSFNLLTSFPSCINPTYRDGCVNEQAEVKKKGLMVPNYPGYFLDYSEIHLTHAQRQINISLRSKVKNPKTRRIENRQLCNVTYDLMLIEYSKHQPEKENPNIHSKYGQSSYNGNAAEFYKHVAETFGKLYCQGNQLRNQFDFAFKKCPFRARLCQS
ncbi:MAG: hypothetical protein KFB95_00945 [Simkaniaceae bacterium]|nr:MAG: hypothetical protein KFB95_00945 [Simkaniaceae bacterium]